MDLFGPGAATPQGGAVELPGRGGFRLVAVPILSALLFMSIFFIPVLGGILNPFAPLPLMYCFFRYGAGLALFSTLLSTAIVAAAAGAKTGVFYFLGYALMGLLLARMMDRQAGLNKAVGLSAAVPFAATALFLWAIMPGTLADGYNLFVRLAGKIINESAQLYRQAGVPAEQVDALQQNAGEISGWVVRLLPGSAATGYLFLALCNYAAYNALQRRWRYLRGGDSVPTTLWNPPEALVFGFIAGLALALVPAPAVRVAGINVLILTLMIYTFAGLCIMQFWFDRVRIPKFLRLVIYILLLLQPFLILALAGTGLFDLWFDFRRIRVNKSGKEDTNGTDT